MLAVNLGRGSRSDTQTHDPGKRAPPSSLGEIVWFGHDTDVTLDPTFAFARVMDGLSADEQHLLLAALRGDDGRRNYAAWLEEHNDIRGEVLRLELRLRDHGDPTAAKRLRDLLGNVDPEWWWVLKTSRIHNCGAESRASPRVRFRLLCTREWAALEPTGDVNSRDCDGCGERVFRCVTPQEATSRALAGQCIAVDPGMAVQCATTTPGLMVGRPDYVAMWARRLFPQAPDE